MKLPLGRSKLCSSLPSLPFSLLKSPAEVVQHQPSCLYSLNLRASCVTPASGLCCKRPSHTQRHVKALYSAPAWGGSPLYIPSNLRVTSKSFFKPLSPHPYFSDEVLLWKEIIGIDVTSLTNFNLFWKVVSFVGYRTNLGVSEYCWTCLVFGGQLAFHNIRFNWRMSASVWPHGWLTSSTGKAKACVTPGKEGRQSSH